MNSIALAIGYIVMSAAGLGLAAVALAIAGDEFARQVSIFRYLVWLRRAANHYKQIERPPRERNAAVEDSE